MGESFGSMLRRYRQAASLTQEALAERASLSVTAIAALERGRNRAPRLSTLRQLGRALELSREELAELSRSVVDEGHDVRAVDARHEAGEGGEGHHPGAAGERADAGALGESGTSPAEGGDGLAGRGGDPAGARSGAARPVLPVSRRWRTRFVGRAAEVGRLRRSWDERRRLVEVVGESGIGKTRLVAEFATRTAAEATVVWGRCNQDRVGSYLPFVEILRRLVADADRATLRAAVGRRGDLSRLLPELVDEVGPLPAPTSAEAGSEERLLFEAVASLLHPWLPMLLVIDDLHWADAASLALLHHLVRDDRLDGLVVLVTTRPADLDPMVGGSLAELGREVRPERVHLGGLPGAELAALVSDLIDADATPELVASVAGATDGNPFFAEELTLHLVDAGLLADTGRGVEVSADAAVPDRVRQTITKRLLLLSPAGMKLVSVASVIGREWDLWVAAAASGLAGEELVDAVDDGLLSGMVLELGPGRLAFSHALVRDAVGARLSFARRASIHRTVAETIEAGWADDPSLAADLARHWAAVAEVDPMATATAATWAVRAGDLALASAAAEEAISRYEEASTLWAVASAGHVDALVRLGFALRHRGRADEADARFRTAIDLARALGDSGLQARAAIGLGRRYSYLATDPERIAALEAALASSPPVDPLLRVGLMGLLVTHLINGLEPGEAERRDALADELGAIAVRATDDPTMLLALGEIRIYDCIEDPAILGPLADRIVEVSTARSALRVEAGARFAQVLAALDLGQPEHLREAGERYRETARRLDDPSELSQDARVRSTLAFVQGRYADAAALSDDAVRLGRASGDFNAELLHFAQGLLRAVDEGQAADVLPLLLAAREYQHIASFDAGTALCAALAGDRDRVLASLERYAERGLGTSLRGADWLAPTAFLAHACHLVGAAFVAAPLHDALARSPATVVRVGPVAGWWGPVDHHLGCLAQLLGRPEEAEVRLRHALVVEEGLGARAFEARTAAELARVLGRTAPAEAAVLARRARTVAAAIGASGVASEVEAVCAELTRPGTA